MSSHFFSILKEDDNKRISYIIPPLAQWRRLGGETNIPFKSAHIYVFSI